jgi:endonuclease III
MILSGSMTDYRLTGALKKLFQQYPDFESLKNLSKAGVSRILSSVGIGRNDPVKGANGARFWTLIKYYYGPWAKKITERNISELRSRSARGFGPKFIGTLQAYCLGNPNVFPMDGKAHEALTKFGLYRDFRDDEVRHDVETKLARCRSEVAIDFHELLRFRSRPDW